MAQAHIDGSTPKVGSSLRGRIMLGMTLVTGLMVALLFIVIPYRLDQAAEQAARETAAGALQLVQGAVEPALASRDPEALTRTLATLSRTPDAIYAQVVDEDGVAMASFDVAGGAGLVPPEPPTVVGAAPVVWLEPDGRTLHGAVAVRSPDGTLRGRLAMGFSLGRLDATRTDNRLFGALVAVGLALVAWVTMALVSTSITLPVARLIRTARQVSDGHLDLVQLNAAAIPPGTRDEVGQLTRAMARMLERLRASQHKLEQRIHAEAAERRDAERHRATAEAHQAHLRDALDLVEQTQAQLVDAEKMATLGQLVAGIAHEVNTPLGAITASGAVVADGLLPLIDGWGDCFPAGAGPAATAARSLAEDGALRDVRLRSREQRKLRRALEQRLQAAGVATPLETAERLTEMQVAADDPRLAALLAHPDPDEAVRWADELSTLLRNADNIRTAAQRARTVVQALKTFARTGRDDAFAHIDLVESISTVLTLYRSQTRLGIDVQLDYIEAAQVQGNPDALSQVWTNLLQNALHAMQGQGTLRISVERRAAHVVVAFANDGPPIPPDVLPRIFDAFYTTKPRGEGSGLGLDIVRKVIVEHGGTLSVASTPAWTTFEVSLPSAPRESA